VKILKNMNWILIWGIVGAIVVAASSFAQWRQTKIQEEKAKVSEAKADSATQRIIVLQKEVIGLQQELNSHQKELINELTGGGNFPILEILTDKNYIEMPGIEKHSRVYFKVLNNSDYPIHDVRVMIMDFEGHNLYKKVGYNFFKSEKTKLGIAALPQNDTYDPFKMYDLRTIPKKSSTNVYVAAASPTLSVLGATYVVEIDWSQGRERFDINFKFGKSTIEISKVNLILNDKSEQDFKKHLITSQLE
jgi:hypothetical protein